MVGSTRNNIEINNIVMVYYSIYCKGFVLGFGVVKVKSKNPDFFSPTKHGMDVSL